MNVPNRIRRISISCPGERRIEDILLNAQVHPVVFKAFQNHFIVCKRCARKVKRLHKFYGILEKELSRPYSPRAIDFAKTLYEEVQSK